MQGIDDCRGCGTVVRDEVGILVMTPPAVAGVRLLASLTGQPIATAPALREADHLPVRLLVVTAPLEPTAYRRVRVECAELEAKLTGIDPAIVLPVLDHGADSGGRPYLLLPRPGPDVTELAPLPIEEVVAAARAAAAGLSALAARGIVGPPPGLCRTGTGLALSPPLPPALVELVATLGGGDGREPPEVLGGGDWTPAGQTFACACLLWTLLSGRPPFGAEGSSPLARLVGAEPPAMRQPGIPDPVVAALRAAFTADPAGRPPTPAALADAVSDAARPDAAGPDATGPDAAGGPAAAGLDAAGLGATTSAWPPVTARPLGSRYLLEVQIGSGAGGHVWAGRRADGAPVAVKLLRNELADDEQALARFVREFRVLLKLVHPNLVRVHDLVIEGGELGIVMDLVDGEDLRRVARRGKLSLADAASLLAQTASGLAAVHAAGVVHRDVKPENILVTKRDGRTVALLSDFGIARAVAGAAHTQMIGTPAYLAPELVSGRPPGPAADIYALGVTAYELLAGRQPFDRTDVDALLRSHLEEPPPRPAGLDDAVWAMLAACLDKTPDARPTAAEAADRWASFATSDVRAAVDLSTPGPAERPDDALLTATAARPMPARPQEQKRRRGRRTLVLGAVTTAVAGLATGAWLAIPDRKPDPPAPPAPRQHPVVASMSLDTSGIGTLTWGSQASALPGFAGYVVVDVGGAGARPVSPTLAGDVTSYRVTGLRPGRRSCYWVIAVGVTAPLPDPLPPFTCVTPPTR